MNEITVFSPATVANLSCGFDVLGLCLNTIGDEMKIIKTATPGIQLQNSLGYHTPTVVTENVAGVAAQAIYDVINPSYGYQIELNKKIKPGSGIGSSSASAIGAVFAINELEGKPFSNKELIEFAMKGEAIASGSEHADNLAPGLYGNITLVRSYKPLDIITIPAPEDLYVSIIHPQIEVKTSEARKVIPKQIPLKSAIKQWGNVGGLVAGLYTKDYDLIGRSLTDYIVEPHRANLIPEFKIVKYLAENSGALGVGISGSGPSIFALSKGEKNAHHVTKQMIKAYEFTTIELKYYTSKINTEGVKIIK